MARGLRACLRAACLAWPGLLGISTAEAQGSLQVPMQFDFLNPGARSLGVGSAFVGLADDATSAFTNPAGLIILTIPEASFEVRGRRLDSPFLRGGRLSGSASNLGIDRLAGPDYGDSPAESTGLSYLSFVFPRNNWRIAAYRHEFVRLEQAFEASGAFQREGLRELALRARRDMSITAYGAATAFGVRPRPSANGESWWILNGKPRLSVGGGVALYRFSLDAQFNRFFSPSFYDAPTFEPGSQAGRSNQGGSTTGWGFNVGALFTAREVVNTGGADNVGALFTAPEVMNPRGVDLVRIGVVYRKAAHFAFQATEGDIGAPVARNGTFKAPDAAGAGVAVRIARKATFTAEITRVQYESLLDGYVSAQTVGSGKGEYFTMDNGTELHAGLEYIFFDVPTSPKLRIGAWRDPDHGVRYEAPANPDVLDERFAAYLPARGSQGHFTFGGGVSIGRVEINAGVDLSGRTRLVSVSSIVRFMKMP